MNIISKCTFLASLYENYNRLLLSVAYKYVSNKEEAEDIVSDCWLSIINHLEIMDVIDMRHLKAYLIRSTRNKAIDFIRRKHTQKASTTVSCIDIDLLKNMVFEDNFENCLLTKISLNDIIETLSSLERRIFHLKLSGFNNRQISHLLSITESAVRIRWQSILQKLSALSISD